MLLSILFGCYSANGLKVQNTLLQPIFTHEDGQELEEGKMKSLLPTLLI